MYNVRRRPLAALEAIADIAAAIPRRVKRSTAEPWLCITLYAFLRLPGVADRQDFPYVVIRVVPIHDPASMLCIDLHIYRTMWSTSVLDFLRLDSGENPIEFLFSHTKTIVLYREGAVRFVKVQGQSIVHVNRRKWSSP